MTKEKTRVGEDASPAGSGGSERVYDLAERTARFGEAVIRFCRAFPKSVVNDPLIRQLVRSGTSVGANYCEADDAVSDKEFRQKIGTCKKEARESKYWLRMLAAAEAEEAEAARELWREAHELTLIFVAIFRKVSRKDAPPPKG
jgi:four helix bundle protein